MSNRSARKELFEKSWNRAEKSDVNDTRKGIARIAQIRALKAQLMGFKNYAAWKLQDQMAKTREAVEAFISKLDEDEIKPYFELNKVLINGVFYAATQLYGITFKERKDLPVYQEKGLNGYD